MSFLIEQRKVNDQVTVPLYFKFSTIPTKCNFTADKFITLENWMNIFDELNPLLTSEPRSSKNKTFDMDSGRLTVKAKWVKISDSDAGPHILKILNVSSSNVGKYFLKIDVKLGSYLERIVSELEQKSKSSDVKSKSKEPSQDLHNSSKHKKTQTQNRKISDMLVKIPKEAHDSTFIETPGIPITSEIPEMNVDDLNKVEEYIPFPLLAPSAASSFMDESQPIYQSFSQIDTIHPEYSPIAVKLENSTDNIEPYELNPAAAPAVTYNPEKKQSEIELNKIKSEYSPTFVTDKSKNDDAVYKPTTRSSKPTDTVEKSKKYSNRSRELFGSSDDDDGIVSSSSQKSKRRLDSPFQERKKKKERSKAKKKKVQDIRSNEQDSSSMEVGDISIRDLKLEPVNDILATYPEHEEYLTGLYDAQIKLSKRNYKPSDLPDMIALDILSSEQFTGMINFLEDRMVRDAEAEHHYSDIIFDLLIPEWSLAIFCKKFQCPRQDAIDRLRMQSTAMFNCSQF